MEKNTRSVILDIGLLYRDSVYGSFNSRTNRVEQYSPNFF